jgi:hypothetical protein
MPAPSLGTHPADVPFAITVVICLAALFAKSKDAFLISIA